MADVTKFLDKEQYEIALARIKAFNEATYLRLSGGTLTGDINLATNTKAIVLATASSWASSDRAIPFSANGEPSKMTYYLDNADTGLTFNPNTGALKAASFVKRGGTSSQFLKADGSVDSNAYLYGTTNQSIIRGVSTEAETWSNLGYADADKGKYNLMIVRHSSGVKNSFGGSGMNYGNTLFFGGADTRAYMGVGYSAPRVVFGGGVLGTTSASSVPDWYMILTGSDATTYNLATIASQAANGNSAYNSLSNYLPLAGGTVTGAIMLDNNNAARIRKDWNGSDNIAALTCNYSGTTTSGFARNALLIAVDDTVYFRLGAYGSYTANASDNKPSYIYLGQYGYNGLNLRIGMDDTLKWGDDEIWHTGNDAPLKPAGPYHNYTNGYLVTTSITKSGNRFPLIKIEGRNHNNSSYYPILTYIQSYTTTSGVNANSTRGINFGHALGTTYLFFNSDNKLCIWFSQPLASDTFWVTAYYGSNNNRVESVTDSALPSGVTTVAVTFKTSAMTDSDITGNAASATALATARTLWGQSFDGTANVSGNMTGVGSITGSGDITTSGNIGIGTTSPITKLQVVSDNYSYASTSFSGSTIYFNKLSTTTTGFNHHISFRRLDASNASVESVRLLGVYSISEYVCTYLAGSEYNNSAIRIDGSGTSATVGIGLANAATYKLQVEGEAYLSERVISRDYSFSIVASKSITTTGWFRIGEFTINHANGGNAIVSIIRNYGNASNESYLFAISTSYNGGVSITQLSGRYQTQLISKIRVVYENGTGKIMYVDMYISQAKNNTYRVNAVGHFKCQTPEAAPELASTDRYLEFTTRQGIAQQMWNANSSGQPSANVGQGIRTEGVSAARRFLITDTAAEKHIEFSKASANYICIPAATSSAATSLCIGTAATSAGTILSVHDSTSYKRVGILNTSPAYTLDVTGVIHSTTGIFSDGYVSAYGVASSSDARLKDGISAISFARAREVLSALNPSEWTWKKDGRRGAGMVAQEVQPVLPDTVSEIGGNLTLEYNTAFAYGLAATKYMLPMVESHEEKIARLEKEVEDLRKELKHFKN